MPTPPRHLASSLSSANSLDLPVSQNTPDMLTGAVPKGSQPHKDADIYRGVLEDSISWRTFSSIWNVGNTLRPRVWEALQTKAHRCQDCTRSSESVIVPMPFAQQPAKGFS